MGLAEDLNAEGEPEREFVPGIAKRMPRKRTASGALVRDHAGRVLFVEPTYKPYLDLPGGMVEDDESPLMACHREIREELGTVLPIGPLLVVDWVPAHGAWGDAVAFVFDGGVLDDDQIANLRLATDELRAVHLLDPADPAAELRPSLRRRVLTALTALADGVPRYAEFGRVR
ncbi:NUDIX hydrolase [Longimycelium tulufanense]|uniref:NUDIX hydrolase n=1 Tax=Longimycelium tulufanense TaxID=907463 RepID=A0A8J3CAV2_9PSEU|nr:NUDIX hydrolase [Longimycelium tulufanense]GGM52241.1 NUDIX hydrolase [Longimycelium tulufanense]